ncbi:MAG: DUF423 domain-containing protein [Campylobacterota bacterium]
MTLNKNSKLLFAIASLYFALAIAIGAFGAHGLEKSVSANLLETYNTGVQYHFYNTLGLMFLAIILNFKESKKILVASWLVIVGMTIFSFSLYLLVILDKPILGAVTPIGGVMLIIAWLLVTIGILKD